MTRVAFLGLGHMGLPMAVNLVKAGHDVRGYDPVPAAVEAASAAGVPVTSFGVDAVAGAEVVITMFPAGKHVLAAYQDGVLAAADPGTLFIESSTIAVDEAQTAHQLALDAGHRNIDAPVSGGVVGAENGTLAFMVGGSDADFADALPLLEVMGKRIVHCGGPGLGQAAKVCNNMVLAVSQIAVARPSCWGSDWGWSTRRCSTWCRRPRGSAGRSPPTARCRDRCRRAPRTATTSRASPAR